MTEKMRYWSLTGMALSVAITVPAMAAVNVTHYWDMGETNVANGDAVGERLDTAGFQTGPVANNNMPNLGSTAPAWNLSHSISSTGPAYSADAAPGGSTVSVDFSGDTLDSLVVSGVGNHPITATANFGFELWVKPKDMLDRNIAYNGQRSGTENGYGFEQIGGEFVAYYGGLTILRGVPTGAPIVPNVWTHLAIVTKWDGVNATTLVTTFYINGEVVDSFIGVPPNSPNGSPNGIDGFYIGSNRTVGTAYSKIDEVRLFNFDPGGFDAINDLANGFFAPKLDGDLNGDGFVGIADLNVVLGNWNQNVTAGDLLSGDPSGDGFVGIADLNVVLGNWNAGTPPSATSVSQVTATAVNASRAESTAKSMSGPGSMVSTPPTRRVDAGGGIQTDPLAERGDLTQFPVTVSRTEHSNRLKTSNGRTSSRAAIRNDTTGRSIPAIGLRVQETDTHGDTISEATELTTLAFGGLQTDTDADYFHFVATAGVQYTMEVIGAGLSDAILTLYNSDGVVMRQEITTDPRNPRARIEWTAAAGGDMYIAVTSGSKSLGGYSITLAESNPKLEGDLDGDGFVGPSDLDIVRAHWNQTVTTGDPLQGDVVGPGGGPADGIVGVADLSAVLSNWNAGTPASEN